MGGDAETLFTWVTNKLQITAKMAFICSERVAAPNDLKLSDGGAWRGSCGVRRRRDIQATKVERTDETGPSQK